MNFRHEPRDKSASATFGPNWDVGSPAILIVDDVPIHRMIICKVAIKAGFAPSEAGNWEEVRRLVAAVDFECATLDLSLGEQLGTEVLRDLYDLDFRAPIVIVSGSDSLAAESAYDFGRALGLNMLEPVGKPLDLARLRKILARILYETRWSRLVRSLA